MKEYVILSPEYVWEFDYSRRDRGVKEHVGEAAVKLIESLPKKPMQEGGMEG